MDTVEVEERTSSNKSPIKKVLRVIAPLLLGVIVLWFLYRKTSFTDIWTTIKDANFAILLFSLVFGLFGNIIRGLRWKLLIEPLGYNPRTSNLIYAVLGSYAVNLIFPRAGEIWRCGVISRDDKIPFVKLVGTLIVDRLSDTIMVILITLLACCFNFDFFANYIRENEAMSSTISNTTSSYWFYIAIILIVVAIFLFFGFFGKTKPVLKIKNFFAELWRDVKSVSKMKTKNRFVIYTIGIWLCYFLYFYITFYAFDFTKDLGITAGLIAFALSSLSMGLPTNGGIGVWHAAVVLALSLYGVSKISAEAFAFGVFAIQNLWVVLYGVFSIVALGINNRHK